MSSALTSIDVTSDVTTWSEWTEVTEVTSEAERWRELREKAEPLLIVARRTTPFITEDEERHFHKCVLHYMNAIRIQENPSDLLHFITVCTDTSNVVTKQYMREATKEYAMETLTAMLERFDAAIKCHGPHAKLLKEVSIRVKALNKIRDFLENIFGTDNEGHKRVDSYRLAKIRMDVLKWEEFIRDCYLLLRALRTPIEMLGSVYAIASSASRVMEEEDDDQTDEPGYRAVIKAVAMDVTIILDNFAMPKGWSHAQAFQLVVDVLVAKSKDHVEVERIFEAKSTLAGESIRTVIKVCTCFKSVFEFVTRRNKHLFSLEAASTDEKLFGPLSAFVARCTDLLEICHTNAQFLSSFGSRSSNGIVVSDNDGDHENEISAVSAKYNLLIGNIKASGRKCLDIENEQLRNDFQVFKSEVHELDYSLLRALKSSFSRLSVREACDVLDTFYSVSTRTRIQETYTGCRDKLVMHLIEELSQQKNSLHHRLTYLTKFYSSKTVEMLRFKGLMVKENAIKKEVFGSRFFSSDIGIITAKVMTEQEEWQVKKVFAKLVSQRLEEPITGSNNPNHFVTLRSLNFDGLLDINIRRQFFATQQEARVLESMGVSLYQNRESFRQRHHSQTIEISHVCRLLTEYNVLLGRLSPNEKGIFRNRLILLDRRFWNGIHKIAWSSLSTVRSWINMCSETILVITNEVLEYKDVNQAIDALIKQTERNQIVLDDPIEPASINTYLTSSERKVSAYLDYAAHKAKAVGTFVGKLESFLEVRDRGITSHIWDEYVKCVEAKVAAACEKAVAKSLRNLVEILTGFRPEPMFALTLDVDQQTKLLTAGEEFDRICAFFSGLPSSLANTDKVSLQRGPKNPIKLFKEDSSSHAELLGISKAMEICVKKFRQELTAFFATLSPLKDFISLKPRNVLDFYHDSDAFIHCCETDIHKLRETTAFLDRQQRKVWINIFMLDLKGFVRDHMLTLQTWQEEFLDATVKAVNRKMREMDDVIDEVKKSFQSKEAMSDALAEVDKNISEVEKRLGHVQTICAIIERTDKSRVLGSWNLPELEQECQTLRDERDQAVEYFSQKKREDLKSLRCDIDKFNQQLESLRANFSSHGPFSLSWKSLEALAELQSVLAKIKVLQEEEDKICSHSTELDHDYCKSELLESFRKEVMNICTVWEVQGEWEAFQAELRAQMVVGSDIQAITRRLETMKKTTDELESFGDAFLEVFDSLKTNLALYAEIVQVVSLLGHKSLRPRHWKDIASHCGIYSSGPLLDNKTFEDLVSILAEKDLEPVKRIVGTAVHEFGIEESFQIIKTSLKNIVAKFETSASGVGVIVNGAELVDKLGGSACELLRLKTDPNAGPFLDDLRKLEESIQVASEKIQYFLQVEKRILSVSETFSSYAVDLSLGKLHRSFQDVTAGWQEVYDALAEKQNALDFVEEDLNKDILTIDYSLSLIQEEIIKFLKTRVHVFPRISFLLLQKSISLSLSKSFLGPSLRCLFPQVKKLLTKTNNNITEVTGYTNAFNIEKKFTSFVQVTLVSVDSFFLGLHRELRSALRSEILESLSYHRHFKQEKVTFSQHAYVIGRLTAFWGRVSAVISADSIQDFRKWNSKGLDIVEGRIAHLQESFAAIVASAASFSEDQVLLNRNALALELFIRSKLRQFASINTDDINDVREFISSSCIRHCFNKETGEIVVMSKGHSFHFGYDETPRFDFMQFYPCDEEDLNKMLEVMTKGKGLALKASDMTHAVQKVKCLAVMLGRSLSVISLHKLSQLMDMELLSAMLLTGTDLLCLKSSTFQGHEIELHKLMTSLSKVLSSFGQESLKNAGGALCKVILLEPQGSSVALGSNFMNVNISCPEFKEKAERSLLNLCVEEVPSLAECCSEIVRLKSELYMAQGGRKLYQSGTYKKSKSYREIKEVFLYGDISVKTIFLNRNKFSNAFGEIWLHEIGEDVVCKPLDQRHFDSGLTAACEALRLQVTPSFKKQTEKLKLMLKSRDFLVLVGPRLCGKSTLVEVVSQALEYDVYHFPSLMFSDTELCRLFEGFLNSLNAVKGKKTDVLIVLHGPLLLDVVHVVFPLLQGDSILLSSGHLMVRTRKFRLIVEAEYVDGPRPEFHVVESVHAGLSWQSLVQSRIQKVMPGAFKIPHLSDELERHVGIFRECRKSLGAPSDLVTEHINVNNFLLLCKTMNAEEETPPTTLKETLLCASLFCFSQDLDESQKDQMELMVRYRLDSFNVPVLEPLYQYFYAGGKWTNYCDECFSELLLPRRRRTLKIAQVLFNQGHISVDVVGNAGVGKTTFLQELMLNDNATNLPINCHKTMSLGHFLGVVGNALMHKSGESPRLTAPKGKFRVFLDNLGSMPSEFLAAVNLLSCSKRFLTHKGYASIEDFAILSTYNGSELAYTNGSNFVLKLEDLREEDLINIFTKSVGSHFSNFEIAVHFHITKLINASVALNRLPPFKLAESSKMVSGLLRAHPDCQDTPDDLSDLWVHEAMRTYRDMIPTETLDKFDEAVVDILDNIVGIPTIKKWNDNKDCLYGDFVSVNGFYKPLDLFKVKKHIVKAMKKYYEKKEDAKDLNIVLTMSTIKIFCLIQRALTAGNLWIAGPDTIHSVLSIVCLVCNSCSYDLLVLHPSDLQREACWRPILRSAVRIAGMDDKPCVLFVSGGLPVRTSRLFDSLSSILNLGIDAALFDRRELLVVLEEEEANFHKIAAKVRKNLHCIVEGAAHDSFGSDSKFFDKAQKGLYKETFLDLITEILGQGKQLFPQDLLLSLDEEANKIDHTWSPATVRPFHATLHFVQDHHDSCRDFYKQLTDQVSKLVSKINQSIEESDEKVASLGVLKERNKDLVSEQGDLQKENTKLKKEIEDITNKVNQHVKVVNEDTMTIMRAKLLVGQEMASSYKLYTNRMDELQACLVCEWSLACYAEVLSQEESVVNYVALFHDIFGLDYENLPDKITSLYKQMVTLSEEKINEVNEHSQLQNLRKEVTPEMKSKSNILDVLVETQRRIENLAKVIRMKNAKYMRIEALTKNVTKEREAARECRLLRYDKNKVLKENLEKIVQLQADISKGSEKINHLEQYAADFNASRKDLMSLRDTLNDITQLLDKCLLELPGSLLLMAAFFAYCGSLNCQQRCQILQAWINIFKGHNCSFKHNFLSLPILKGIQFRQAINFADIPKIRENMSMLEFLPSHLLVIDPLVISIEYLFRPSQTGVIYSGDPQFDSEFETLKAKFDTIIVRHFVFDLDVFQRTFVVTLQNQEKSIKVFHVVTEVTDDDLAAVNRTSVLNFELSGEDLNCYVLHHMKKLILPNPPETEDDKREKGKFQLEKVQRETEEYLTGVFSLSNPIQVKASISTLKKLKSHDYQHHPSVIPGFFAQLKFVEAISRIGSDMYVCLNACPTPNLKPLPIKKFLPRFKEAYDKLMSPSLSPSDHEIALTLAENHMKEYAASASELDFVLISAMFILFLFLNDSAKNADILERRLVSGEFGSLNQELSSSYVSSNLAKLLFALANDDLDEVVDVAKTAAEDLFGMVYSGEFNLEKLYAQAKHRILVVKVPTQGFVDVYEILCEFAKKQRVSTPNIVDISEGHQEKNFWLLEEALFEGQWIICLVNSNRGQRLQQMNYIRFLLEKCSPSTGLAKTQHFHFRLWILCDSDRDFRPLTPMTAPSHCIALNRANQETFAAVPSRRYSSETLQTLKNGLLDSFNRVLKERKLKSCTY